MGSQGCQNSEFSEHASASRSSSPASPLVRRQTVPRRTVFTRLSRTMSQILDKEIRPPSATLAPPAFPQEHPDVDDLPPAIPRIPNGSRPSPSGSSEIEPSLLERLKITLLLENSGSVARDHLASERTFLAYVRTSLAIASTGVALVQLFTISTDTTSDNKTSFLPTTQRIQAWARPLGATMVCFGLVVLTFGTIRYFRIQSALIQGMFPVARLTAASITFVLATIVIIVFAIMLSARS
ncbi:DUF202 domain-containing protein [Mycena sanguinolenta]|uniref:DUF202 domain-containing protein n=1 Tax=Mycena sanguinolenta TaxID=230812 RepID=A0A8H6Z5B1_9AGAR|nr:DUF202 domain-containing protein [Mycena sanguinolenta]